MAVNPPPRGGFNIKQLLNDTVGPMAALTIGATAFVKAMAGAALNAEKMQAALQASGEANRLTALFKTLLGSADAARKKVAELTAEAQRSPFAFEALGKAALNLQALSKGAFNSTAALQQVQDVAAATGAPVDAVAGAMGGLAGALKSGGDGVATAANQLAEMGAISDQTARKIADLAQSGAPASEAMRLLAADTAKAKGAAQELASTVEGLQQQLSNQQMASDAKIGDMFKEANEAGGRAALGFQKFGAALQEAAAGPWAVMMSGVQGVKEALGNFLATVGQMGVVQGVFKALGTVAAAVLTILAVSLLGASKAIIGFIIQTRVAQAAMVGMMGTARAWAGLMTGLSGGLVLVASGLVMLATKAIQARQQVASLNRELQQSRAQTGQTAGSLASSAAAVQTPEDLDKAKSSAKEAVAAAQKNLADAKQRRDTARQDRDKYYGINPDGTRGMAAPDVTFGIEGQRREDVLAAAEQGVSDAESGLTQIQGFAQQILSINQAALALDAKRTQEARERAKLEREIAEDARLAAAQMGAGSKEALQVLKDDSAKKRQDAEKASQKIDTGRRAIAEVKTERPEFGASSSQKELDAAIAQKDEQLRALRGQKEEQSGSARSFGDVQSAIAAGGRGVTDQQIRQAEQERQDLINQRTQAGAAGQTDSLRAAFAALQEIERKAPTDDNDVTRTSAQIAQRQLLRDAETEATKVLANTAGPDEFIDSNQDGIRQANEEGGPSADQRTAAQALLNAVIELTNSIGGAEQTSGAAIQQLEFRRDEGLEKSNLPRAIQTDESNANLLQGQAVAEAEAEFSMQRLRNETMIAQLKKTGAQVAQEELQAQLKAAQALERAQKVAAAPVKEGNAAAFDEAQERVKNAEVRAEDYLEEKPNLTANEAQRDLEQAQKATADAAVDLNLKTEDPEVIQNELRPKVDKVLAGTATEDEQRIVEVALEMTGLEDVEALDAALIDLQSKANQEWRLQFRADALKELEEAREAAANVAPGNKEQAQQAQAAVRAAEVQLAAVGGGGRSADEIQAEQVAAQESQAKVVSDMNRQAQIQALRVQENFGTDRRGAKEAADALEDEALKEERAREIGKTVSNPNLSPEENAANAKSLAGFQVDMERAAKNIEETKQPRMSDLASVGGAAGFGGLVNDPSAEIKKLQEIAKQQKDFLQQMNNREQEMAQWARTQAGETLE
jgi:hypothetical protein